MLAGGGSVSGAAPVAVAAKSAVGTGAIRVGTFNIRAGVSTSTHRLAVTAFRARVDVAGLQEINSKENEAVLETFKASGWNHHRPARFRGEQDPILWNTAMFRLVSARSVKTADATNVGNEAPGKDSGRKTSFTSVVRPVHLGTQRPISIINVHLAPGAVRAGRRVPGRPRLFRLYVREMANVAALAKSERQAGQQPSVLGEFNVGWVAEKHRTGRLPFRKFKGAGMRSMCAASLTLGQEHGVPTPAY